MVVRSNAITVDVVSLSERERICKANAICSSLSWQGELLGNECGFDGITWRAGVFATNLMNNVLVAIPRTTPSGFWSIVIVAVMNSWVIVSGTDPLAKSSPARNSSWRTSASCRNTRSISFVHHPGPGEHSEGAECKQDSSNWRRVAGWNSRTFRGISQEMRARRYLEEHPCSTHWASAVDQTLLQTSKTARYNWTSTHDSRHHTSSLDTLMWGVHIEKRHRIILFEFCIAGTWQKNWTLPCVFRREKLIRMTGSLIFAAFHSNTGCTRPIACETKGNTNYLTLQTQLQASFKTCSSQWFSTIWQWTSDHGSSWWSERWDANKVMGDSRPRHNLTSHDHTERTIRPSKWGLFDTTSAIWT